MKDKPQYVWAHTIKGERKTIKKHRGVVICENEDGCDVEGCRGEAFLVKWPDGDVTTCCTKAMSQRKNGDYQL